MNPFFLKAFSPYGVSPFSVVDFTTGLMHPRHEILALLPMLVATGKSIGVTFNFADSDLDTIVAAFATKERLTMMGLSDAVNAAPDICRDISQYAMGEDLWQLQLAARVGQAIPASTGTATQYRIPLSIPFANVQKENPNLNAISAGQLFTNARCDIEGPMPALPATVPLVGGSIQFTSVNMEMWALAGSIRPLLWMAGAPKIFTRAANGVTIESEGGPIFDEFVFTLVDGPSFPNSNDNVQIVIDGKQYIVQTPIQNLPLGFSGAVKSNETAVPSYDVAQNTKARPAAPRVGRVPLIYIEGIYSPLEKDWPAVMSGRQINFGAKTTAAPQLAFWRQTPITSTENMQHLATMQQDPRLRQFFTERAISPQQAEQIAHLNFGDLAIEGGGSSGPGAMNSDLSMWKPRAFAPKRGSSEKTG